jgi:ABC-type bacteriocin/lantibiotic exporter with double-glycine peptidase domain
MKRFAVVILLMLILGRTRELASEESRGVWLDVPFVKQTEDGCGSAAISMLLQYWNAHGTQVAPGRADAAAIQKRLYSPKARGIFASDMESYLREAGFRVFPLEGEWRDLQQQLQEGRPLIVSLQPGNQKAPLHYVVVTGIDWQSGAVFIHDPARGKLLRVVRADFENEWRPNHNWMLLALPQKAA